MEGIVRTRVGYAGGTKADPTYRRMGDHTETLQVDFDPQQISYLELLNIFWDSHNPLKQSWSRQYRNAVLYHNDMQNRDALESRQREAERRKREIRTDVLPLAQFYLAEDYHQKYYLRQNRDMMREFMALYPSSHDFINSTAAARVNGYLGGNGTLEQLQHDLPQLGLSPGSQNFLLERLQSPRHRWS